ncbi:MAG: DNA repair protein RecO [Desulfitobacteriia bacterium]
MALYKADALVIRSREYGEADRLVTLFSREKGKLVAIAKGVRKPKSKQRGGTQLFTYADFLLYKGRTLDTINQVQPRESFSYLFRDFDRTLAASGMAELLDISTVREHPEPRLFTLTLSYFFLLEHLDPYLAQAAYTLKLLKIQGYYPVLTSCSECGQSTAGMEAFLCLEADGLLCVVCGKNRLGKKLNPGSVAFMQQLTNIGVDKIDRLRWNSKMRAEILEALCFFCEGKFERKLQAWRQEKEFRNKS